MGFLSLILYIIMFTEAHIMMRLVIQKLNKSINSFLKGLLEKQIAPAAVKKKKMLKTSY